MIGGHCGKHWSSTQTTVALSSAEAEYMALVKSASVALGLQALYADIGEQVYIHLHTDASACKSIATRRGLGKLRHINVALLWLQEKVATNSLRVSKVAGALNPSDQLTKYTNKDIMNRHMKYVSLSVELGRAVSCPMLRFRSWPKTNYGHARSLSSRAALPRPWT